MALILAVDTGQRLEPVFRTNKNLKPKTLEVVIYPNELFVTDEPITKCVAICKSLFLNKQIRVS